MSQTTVQINMDGAFAGMVGTNSLRNTRSYSAEGALPFGRGAIQGTDPVAQAAIAAAAGLFIGFVESTQALESKDNAPTVPGYVDEETANILTFGDIWVDGIAASLPTVGATTFYVATAADANQGKVTTVSTSNLLVPGRVLAVDSTNNLVLVHVNAS